MKWISVEDRLPEKCSQYNQADKWKLCSTVDGAILLSLCYYDHDKNVWRDAFNPSPETRVAFWAKPTSPLEGTK